MKKISPIQSRLLSKINERLVLRMLRDRGPATRAEMSKTIGITFPTVAKAVSSLLDSKFLEEVEDEATTRPGRPAKLLRLASKNSQVIGVTLSNSDCCVASASLDGVIHPNSSLTFTTPPTYDALLIEVTKRIKKCMLSSGRSTLIVGISVPAVVDYQQQRAVLSANMPLVNGKWIGRDLEGLLGVECLIVRDTHALSLSERLHGEEEPVSNFAMLDLCGGVGLGLVVDGKLLTGDSGFSGELGHTPIVPDGDKCHCGRKGCLETVASEWALEAKISLVLRRTVRIPEILEMAQAGNKQVLAELESMCHYLAIGVAHVINIVNPGTFYVYGRVFEECPQLLKSLVEKTKQYALGPSFAACRWVHASGGVMDGTIASVINYLTDSLVPDLDGYVRLAGVPLNRPSVAQ